MFSLQQKRALFYAAGTVSISILYNLFVTFYVEMFVVINHVTSDEFYLGQLVYCIWNSVNDPIFGWIGDRAFVNVKNPLQRRLFPLRFGGPLWAFSCVLLWRQPPAGVSAGAYFIFCMIVFDGLHTYTTVAYQALLADMTSSTRQRELCNVYCAYAHMIGCLLTFLGHKQWNASDPKRFQEYSILIAFLSSAGFVLTSFNPYLVKQKGDQDEESDAESTTGDSITNNAAAITALTPSIPRFLNQVRHQETLYTYSMFSFVQQFTCSFNTNFFSIILAAGAGGAVSHDLQSITIGLAFVVPHVATLWITPKIPKYGKKASIRTLLLLRLLTGTCGVLLGLSRKQGGIVPYLFCGLFILCRVFSECICRLQPLVVTDVVDEDVYLNRRPVSMAGSISGIIALVSKPAQSLAPIFGCYYLGLTKADQAVSNHNTIGTTQQAKSSTSIDATVAAGLFFVVQMATSAVLLTVWSQYKLDGSKLDMVRRKQRGLLI
eukprot:PhF_6_TR12910/c0_g1_i1/m.20348